MKITALEPRFAASLCRVCVCLHAPTMQVPLWGYFTCLCYWAVCEWFFICMLCDWHCACVFACMLRHKEGLNILQLQKKLKVLPVRIQSIESFLFVAWPGIPLQKPCVLWVHCWLLRVSFLCAMVMIVPHDTSFSLSFFTWKIDLLHALLSSLMWYLQF
jgi:hypothetical protein